MYQKTNAMSEIKKTNKDNFWAQAEVTPVVFLFLFVVCSRVLQLIPDN